MRFLNVEFCTSAFNGSHVALSRDTPAELLAMNMISVYRLQQLRDEESMRSSFAAARITSSILD